jgi:hypothetical protein
MTMPAEYFETRFRLETPVLHWPKEFVIVSAYPTTGECWSDDVILEADQRLERELKQHYDWLVRITGYSPTTGHAEPSWAFVMPLSAACDLGLRYKQDAIYHIKGDVLSVTYCDGRRKLVTVGVFRSRL